MKHYLILSFLLLSFIGLNGQEISKKELKYEPVNLNEAVDQLSKILPDSTQKEILSMTESEFLAGSHFGLGMWIRNNWRLWKGGELADYFKSKGIFHPDDMSGIILTCFYRQLHHQDWELNKQIKSQQDYWKEQQEYNYRLVNDTAFARQKKDEYENSIRERNEKLKLEFPIGSQVKAWVDYSTFGSRTQITGEIVDWRIAVSKGGALGSSPKGPKIENEYLEARIKVIEFIDTKKKKKVERHNRMTNDELWVNINLINKME